MRNEDERHLLPAPAKVGEADKGIVTAWVLGDPPSVPQPCTHAELTLQFCEILSAPELSRWAGPIIDVLLDYVGNVQLCARLKEHIDSFEDWAVIREKAGREWAM